MKFSKLNNIHHKDSKQFFLIAGPCVVESEQLCIDIAGQVLEMCDKFEIPYIFKASYRKANRTRVDSYTGEGDEIGLNILQNVSKLYNIPVTTDIHTDEDAAIAAQYVDILQIPAFLCRQTSLLVAAAKTDRIVNVKKGQFASPEAMQHAVDKIRFCNNPDVWLTDRGTCFGYHDLLVDYRSIPTMKSFDVPVIMDCTHSLQQPNQTSGITGGRPDLIPTIAKAAIAVGADGLFIETHPKPSQAKSDGANMLPLHELENLLLKLVRIREAVLD